MCILLFKNCKLEEEKTKIIKDQITLFFLHLQQLQVILGFLTINNTDLFEKKNRCG